MGPADERALERTLLQRGLDAAWLEDARKVATRTNGTLAGALVQVGALDEPAIAAAAAEAYGLGVWDGRVDAEATKLLDELMRRIGGVVVARGGSRATVAASRPIDPVHEESLRFGLRAREIEVVIGAEHALARARATALDLARELAPELSELRRPAGPRWEAELRARWEAGSGDEPEIRLANLLLIALTARTYEALRIDVDSAPTISARVGGRWVPPPEIGHLANAAHLAAILAARYAMMTGRAEGYAAVGWGHLTVLFGAAAAGGERRVFEVVSIPKVGGTVILLTCVRSRYEPTPEADKRVVEVFEKAQSALDARRLHEIGAQFDAIADVVASQERHSFLEACVLRMRADAAYFAGDVAGAIALRKAALACTDDAFLLRHALQLDLGVEEVELGRYDEGIARLSDALSEASAWLGASSEAAFRATFVLGLAQIDAGLLAEAAVSSRNATALAPHFRTDAISALHLETRLALATGDAARAAKVLDEAQLEDHRGDARLYAALLYDAARAHLALGDPRGALARAEEAALAARKKLVSTHKELRDIELLLEELRPKHPYR